MSQTPHEAALEDILPLVNSLELPYLEALQQLLNEHIAKRRMELLTEARAKIMAIAASVRMDPEELVALAVRKPRAPIERKPSRPRYRDPATGKTWSGFGTIPGWIRDKDRSQFLIEEEA
jgi:DNA-binding protein H-NS